MGGLIHMGGLNQIDGLNFTHGFDLIDPCEFKSHLCYERQVYK